MLRHIQRRDVFHAWRNPVGYFRYAWDLARMKGTRHPRSTFFYRPFPLFLDYTTVFYSNYYQSQITRTCSSSSSRAFQRRPLHIIIIPGGIHVTPYACLSPQSPTYSPLSSNRCHETRYPPLLEMGQSPSTPGATGERHRLLFLISACFWVIRESPIPAEGVRLKNGTRSVSLVIEMVQVTLRFRHHIHTPSDLFDNPDCKPRSDRVRHPCLTTVYSSIIFIPASDVQLLASIPLPRRILRVPRTSPRQIRRPGTTPRRQQSRSVDNLPRLTGRFLASGQGLRIAQEAGVPSIPRHSHPS